MDIKVSVIIAVYNSEKFLREALESVINQTLMEIEIICVDDGSTDNSLDIIREYALRDSRIRILRHEEKTPGAAAARNMGMDAAKGKYLSFLDSDDFFEPEMLELAYKKAEIEEAEVTIWDGYMYDDRLKIDFIDVWPLRKEYLHEKEVFVPIEVKDSIFRITPGGAWNVLFSHDMVREKNIRFADAFIIDDMVFVYTAFAEAKKIAIIRERLIHYRKNNENSQTGKAHEHPEVGYLSSLMLRDELKKRGLLDNYKVAFVNMSAEIAFGYLANMKTEENFNKLFFDLKKKYMRELCLYDIPDNAFLSDELLVTRNLIEEKTPTQFLLDKSEKKNFENIRFINFISKLKKGDKIVIYGGGKVGRQIFNEMKVLSLYELVGWVDTDYKRIGFPMQAPKELRNMEFDVVVIAVKSKVLVQEIKLFLMEIGVNEDKIILGAL